MPRFAYVNGRYVRHADAAVHIEDRGYQLADGVYEVFAVIGGKLIDEPGHLERLDNSLSALRIARPLGTGALRLVMRELIRRNGLRDGALYIQMTRGVAPRDFKFPKNVMSSVVMTTRRLNLEPRAALDAGVRVVTVPDLRWARPDIKSTGLLAQVLAKQTAAEAGAFEAWLVDGDGLVTEGASSNAWIVTGQGVLVTRQADHAILKGITGNSIEHLAAELGLTIERRAFTVDEACRAREVFLTSATNFVLSITQIDGNSVGDGRPGDIARTLRRLYLDYATGRQSEAFRWRA